MRVEINKVMIPFLLIGLDEVTILQRHRVQRIFNTTRCIHRNFNGMRGIYMLAQAKVLYRGDSPRFSQHLTPSTQHTPSRLYRCLPPSPPNWADHKWVCMGKTCPAATDSKHRYSRHIPWDTDHRCKAPLWGHNTTHMDMRPIRKVDRHQTIKECRLYTTGRLQCRRA